MLHCVCFGGRLNAVSCLVTSEEKVNWIGEKQSSKLSTVDRIQSASQDFEKNFCLRMFNVLSYVTPPYGFLSANSRMIELSRENVINMKAEKL